MSVSTPLLEKYDVPGSRYTSYPTILHWNSQPTQKEWIESVAQNLNDGESEETGAAIYIHIPFCRSLCTYCGCNSRITTKRSVARPYVLTVLREWELYGQLLENYFPLLLSQI